ncbi:hypothetical protein [Nocardia puris]|uniref:Uncharacterized protein n=1 Tax=Nocardia puris TaxID=208602 RepID=A0A366DFD2_9NOCA|nr:hypothetical protein [Nocardia puris]RBO88777.1 hypothetical protein DFR74_1081 [Nocardia puris]
MLNEFYDAYATHTDNARLVATNGGTLSKEWLAIDANYEAFRYRQVSFVHDLTHAVINGEDEATLNQLHTLAIASAMGGQQGTDRYSVAGTAEALIDREVRQQVTNALVQEYAKTGAQNFKAVGARLLDKITELKVLSDVVDIDADPSALVGQPMKIQQAWMQAGDIVNGIDKAFAAFQAAAALEGRVLTRNDQAIGLVCPTTGTGAERRELWDAWDSDKRTGRWGALIKAGIDLKPISSVREYTAYDRPTSEWKTVQAEWGGMQQFLVDSEDNSIKVDKQ